MNAQHLFYMFVVAAVTAQGQEDFSEHIAALKKDPIKMAAFVELGNTCSSFGPYEVDFHRQQSKILIDAGPGVIPALVYLVTDRVCSAYFVGCAAEYATEFQYSAPLRTAMRARRDDKNFEQQLGWYLGVFKYFAAFGDRSDLAWMETTFARMSESLRPEASNSIQQLRKRLLLPSTASKSTAR